MKFYGIETQNLIKMDKIKKELKDLLWELDNKYTVSVPDTQGNINNTADEIVKLFALGAVSQHRELLIAYHKFLDHDNKEDEAEITNNVDAYLSNL